MSDYTSDEVHILTFFIDNNNWDIDYVEGEFTCFLGNNSNRYKDEATVKAILAKFQTEGYLETIDNKVRLTQKGKDLCENRKI